VAVKFSEKARISPEKLGVFVKENEGAVFTPNGVLRLILTEHDQEHVLDLARSVLLRIRAND
jgi:hypothetical protein